MTHEYDHNGIRMSNDRRERYAIAIIKSKKPIVVNDALMHGLGYDDTRTFFSELGNWGYNSDFGQFSDATDTRVQSFLRSFIKDQFIN